ncbi:hypothetical protein IV203_020129 [Nitzschia inconspicua]|uniref:Uncharacterized protein n=1 Tax=Nitzschia inconspicua TaxID=303405 RepID=A0A9K3M0K8_9STRA|nr:hypothetical protein IV203_020129 [Nitzschia inconspicua]
MPSQTLHSWTKDLLRARKKLLENMKKSGEHDSDMYSFVRIALKGTNLVKTIGEFTLYYFCLKASSVPDFDKTFSPFMDGRLKGDSTSTFGRDDEVSAMTGGRDTVLTSQEQSMERMAISFELIQQCTCSANERQMRLAALQEAGILEKRLQRADDGSPLRPDIRARMQAKLEKLYEDLY